MLTLILVANLIVPRGTVPLARGYRDLQGKPINALIEKYGAPQKVENFAMVYPDPLGRDCELRIFFNREGIVTGGHARGGECF